MRYLQAGKRNAIVLAAVFATTVPFVHAQTTAPATTNSGIRVINDFECSSLLQFESPEPNHVVITLDDSVSLDGWMFRLDGVAGKTVRIDIKSNQTLSHWTTLNPVYAVGSDLDDPALYIAAPSTGPTVKLGRVTFPSTSGQKWHFIPNSKLVDNSTFTMTQAFESNSVWISNHVPCPPGYNEKFIRSLASNPLAKVVEIGRTSEDRPQLMVQIGADDAAAKSKPCILIFGGEQAEQPDGMWSSDGAIEFLLSDADAAKQLRNQCRFLIIPIIDLDGTADSHPDFVGQFQPQSTSTAASNYADFFQKWIGAGNRLDVIFDLHSLESKEAHHLSRAFIEGGPTRGPLATQSNLGRQPRHQPVTACARFRSRRQERRRWRSNAVRPRSTSRKRSRLKISNWDITQRKVTSCSYPVSAS